MRRILIAFNSIAFELPIFVVLANWAQTSGTKATDNIVPPSYFAKRYGHALVVIDAGDQGLDYVQEAENDKTKARLLVDRMFVLGGDDYNVVRLLLFVFSSTKNLARTRLLLYMAFVLFQRGGGGGYKNDIWVTSGAGMYVFQLQQGGSFPSHSQHICLRRLDSGPGLNYC